MSEQPHALQPESALDPAQAIREGLEKAHDAGFDFDRSLAIDTPDLSDAERSERATQIFETMATISHDLGLEASFYEKPAQSMLMASIASSWIKAQQGESTVRAQQHREMLVDTALIMAGKQSSFVRSFEETAPHEYARYAADAESRTKFEARQSYLDEITDSELSTDLASIIADTTPGSVLESTRQALAIEPNSETPFSVHVLKVGNGFELGLSGIVPRVEYPAWPMPKDPAERELWKQSSNAAQRQQAENQPVVDEYERNERIYNERFGESDGTLFPAFVEKNADGEVRLYLRASDAQLIVNMRNQGNGFTDALPVGRPVSPVAVLRHEYAHTQKSLVLGSDGQLGLILEERKAELVSHDRSGYQDVKLFVQDMGRVHGINAAEQLAQALRQPDALAAVMASYANNYGLENALLMMTTTPNTYHATPEVSQKFVRHMHMHETANESDLNAVVRQNLELHGSEAFDQALDDWVAHAAPILERSTNGLTLEDNILYAENTSGITARRPYVERAVKRYRDGRVAT